MTDFIKCKALVACTEFVAGYGMVHMDPDNEECAYPMVPAQAVARLVADERIEVLDDPLDHDADGKSGGSLKRGGGEVAALRAEYKAKFGKNAFNGWDADALREKIAAADGKSGGSGADDSAPAGDTAP